jgi:hypothetical protein
MKKVNTDNLMVLDNKEFKKEFLGRILWFTISDCKVSFEELKTAFKAAGIDEKYLPKEISPRDAFRRATKVAEAKRIKLDDDTYLNLLVREVKMADDEIVRQLVREVVDSKNTRLEYLPVVEFGLKNDTDFSADCMIDTLALYQEEIKAMKNVTIEYEKCRQNYNGRHVRELVQGILSGCDPVAVRPSGGVYFVPEKHGETVQSLSDMVKILSQYSINSERSRLYSVPVIDAKEHREMVAESLEDQVKNNGQSIVSEMANVLKSGRNITQKTAEQYINKVKDLKSMVAKYSDMLQTEILNVDEIMDIAMKQARKLLDTVEAA